MGPKQPVSVAGIEFDALIDSSEKYDANIPQYPIETGVSISDNIALNQTELSMTLYVTGTPVTWKSRHGTSQNRVDEVCNQLLSAYFERTPVEVVTGNKVWKMMAIKSISIDKTESTGYAREIPITLEEITVTNTAVVQIPDSYSKSGKTKENNGSAKTTSTGSSSSGSSSRNEVNTSGAYGTGESHYAWKDDSGNVYDASGKKIGSTTTEKNPTLNDLKASTWTLDSYLGQDATSKIQSYVSANAKNLTSKVTVSTSGTSITSYSGTFVAAQSDKDAARQKLTGDYQAKSWGETLKNLVTGYTDEKYFKKNGYAY